MMKRLTALPILAALLLSGCGALPTPASTLAPPPVVINFAATATAAAANIAALPSATAAAPTPEPSLPASETAAPAPQGPGAPGGAPTEDWYASDASPEPPEDIQPGGDNPPTPADQPPADQPPPDAGAYPPPAVDNSGEGSVVVAPTPPVGSDALPTVAAPQAAASPTVSPTPDSHPFRVQAGTPLFTADFAHPQETCRSMFVAGQVLDGTGRPIPTLVVNVRGVLNGQAVDSLGMTGTAPLYGPGGFEIRLPGGLADSTAALTIQILGLDARPLTGEIPFDTAAGCTKNLIVINFEANAG